MRCRLIPSRPIWKDPSLPKKHGMIVLMIIQKLTNMDSDKNVKPEDEKEKVKSPDKVETPPPPQHMDPSKKPEKDRDKQEQGKK
ncbi:MAG TPA: hypothetical protein PKX08_18140 [Cyclobacteriaceae bacterium]|nr:hypothetical protein [Cyclobacteriaceae bacterium]